VSGTRGGTAPPPLVVAASLVGLEGLLIVVYAVLELTNLHADRVTMGLTTSAFFAILGGGLIAGGWMIAHGNPRARSPILVAQLIFVGVAWSFRGGSTTPLAIGIAVVALLVVAGTLHPASFDALSEGGDTP
jgi:hypothetical protein